MNKIITPAREALSIRDDTGQCARFYSMSNNRSMYMSLATTWFPRRSKYKTCHDGLYALRSTERILETKRRPTQDKISRLSSPKLDFEQDPTIFFPT